MTDNEIVSLLTENNEEIAKLVKSVSAKAAGQIHALTIVLRAMQRQPGFDRQQFLRDVADFQVILEGTDFPEEVRPSFNGLLEQLCSPR